MEKGSFVWVFNGVRSHFASAVFSEKEIAIGWIRAHSLSGVLTAYPLDEAVYDWAVRTGTFTPKRSEHTAPEFIGKFSSASLPHLHFEDGRSDQLGDDP